ncbi:MAG: hypothetical protein VXX85_00250 [Candidatus Margulisiibacteriota bacterium]|nr:hypothetical protein [Candidatus Margulisiibacteriota bacterium]
MQSLDIEKLKKQAIIKGSITNSSNRLSLDDIKSIEQNLQALFAKNVNEIHMKTKWTSDETKKGLPTIACKLTKNTIYMQQTKDPTDQLVNYKYQIKRDELLKNNTIVTDEGKAMFFKHLVKLIEWAEAEKLDVAFK